MRKIKFRAYRKFFKTMHEVYSLGKYYSIIWADITHKNGDREIVLMEVPNYELEILQFAGMFDVDDKEIYEGDLLKDNRVDEDNIYTVEYEDGGFYAEGLDNEYLWNCLDYLKKIGNKFENPEEAK